MVVLTKVERKERVIKALEVLLGVGLISYGEYIQYISNYEGMTDNEG